MRLENDVAAVAGGESPVSIYDSVSGTGWDDVYGTSAATPVVAGVEGLSSAYSIGLGAEAFYRDPGGLFDVTEDANGAVCSAC
jgi:hypothetical protein